MTRRQASQGAAREAKTVFLCAECGNESPKWFGRCPHCGAWNSAREGPGRREATAPRAGYGSASTRPATLRFEDIEGSAEDRWRSGIGELDRVVGRLDRGEGSLGKAMTDSTLYDDLRETLKNTNQLVKDIQKNPKRYLKLSVF